MTITFLGTGTSQGVPVIGCDCAVCRSGNPKDNRLRTSVHISHKGLSIVIDTGPDFRQQMLRENIRSLDGIFYTHPHKDHVAGMDDIRSYYFRQKKEIPLYASKATIERLKAEFPYVFYPGKYKGIPKVAINEILHDPFRAGDMLVYPFKVFHHLMPVMGFRIGDFTYITDANRIPDQAAEIIRGSRIMVINALQKEAHPTHFTLGQALDEIKKLKPEKAYLTHISHHLGLHDEVSKELPDNVFLAFDGLRITL